VVLSRFHWNLATIWTDAIIEEDKPNVGFSQGVHTPIVESKSDELRYIEIEPNVPIHERIAITDIYIPLFLKVLKSFKFGEKQSYEDLIVQGQVPGKYLFKLANITTAVLIGHFPSPDDLPQPIRKKLWPK
jgi:hypothetical protein